MSDLSPLSGVKRKSNFGAVRSVDDPARTSGVFNIRCSCQSNTLSRRFVDYLLCGVVNYDWRLEILKLGLASVGGLNSFLEFRAVSQLRCLDILPVVNCATAPGRFVEQECFADQVWVGCQVGTERRYFAIASSRLIPSGRRNNTISVIMSQPPCSEDATIPKESSTVKIV
jgi:hypothetical protein